MTQDIALQERLAHLERLVDDLSDVIARQDRDIAQLQARVRQLMEREAARETAGLIDGSPHQKPPHW